MRILWMSNTPLAGTGYGVQTAEVVPLLKEAGHEVALAVNWGINATVLDWNGVPMFPSSKDRALNDIIAAHADTWKADWTISLYDTWTMIRDRWPERVASWVPIDHQPVPPEVLAWCQKVTPIAMSRFGQAMLRDQGLDSHYVPHSVDTGIFKPTELTRTGQKPREALGIPSDAFVVMIAAANQGIAPPRKAWGEMFDAMGYFMRQHPDVWLYVHTDTNQVPPSGVDLKQLVKMCGIPEDRLRWTDAYAYTTGQVKPEDLAALYSMSDVLLASSMGEGFGIPVIEAQACGLPVIVSDFTAQPELCDSGWLVKGQPWRDPSQGSTAFLVPYIKSIVDRLTEAYAARGDNGLRERAVAFAAQYDTRTVFDRYWKPVLAEMEAALEPPMNRAQRRAKKRKAA